MGFLDSLKQRARQEGAQAVKTALSNSANRSWTVTLPQLPVTLEQMKRLPQASLQQPQDTAALTVAALNIYPVDRDAAIEMLNFLKGPQPLSTFEKQFLADRFRDKDYVPRSFFRGTSPENNYEPTRPYTIEVSENPYSRDQINEGYLTLHLRSSGADSPRQIKLRRKPSTGQWFLWEQFLLSDIRPPAAADPWA